MTANQIDTTSTELNNLSMSTSPRDAKRIQKSHSPASKSVPNLQQMEDIEISASCQELENDDKSVSDTAYNYAASTISGAYNYMTSFYGQPPTKSQSLSNMNGHGTRHRMSEHKNGNILGESKASSYDASIPDTIKYPMTEKDGDSRQSNLKYLLETIENNGIDNEWTKHFTEPLSSAVPLRSMSYGSDRKKTFGAPPVFRLAHVQAFKTEQMIDHIAQHPCSWFNQNISVTDMSCFTMIVHLQVKSVKTSFITYHVLTGDTLTGYNSNGTPIVSGDSAITNLLDLILNCNDVSILNNRMKMIPRIVSGPYPVKRVVENRPVLLGNKVPQKYFRGANYFEIDVAVDASLVAASCVKLCHRFAKRIVVEMAWTIQGEHINELPERMICGCTIHNMNFDKCKDIQYHVANGPKLDYNFTKYRHNNENVIDELKENK